MNDYGVADVARLLGISASTIRAFVDAGFVTPARGPRNALRFSFQDLIVLRTAQGLAKANVPQRRIVKAVRELRRNLPATMPLSGLSIAAVAGQMVVREGAKRWQADGQYLLEFEGDPTRGKLKVIEPEPEAPDDDDAQTWIDYAEAVEGDDPKAAIDAYQQAIDADPSRLDARINLGRLLHEAQRFAKAEAVYRSALLACGSEALLLFNLGVLLEDMNRRTAAAEAYEAALREDPSLEDAHYNLALLYRRLGRPREAIRHLAQYRKLKGSTT